MAFFSKLKDRLFKSSAKIDEGLDAIISDAPVEDPAKPSLIGRMLGRSDEPKRELDDAMLESLEDVLVTADMGASTAARVVANIAEGRFGKRISAREIKEA
ncbi:MAG: signal recognition particle receptor subunit alpha, partial [Deltaproteobacteria bacterium]